MIDALNKFFLVCTLYAGFIFIGSAQGQNSSVKSDPVRHFLVLVTSSNEKMIENSLDYIEENWDDSYEIMMIETLYFSLRREVARDYLELLERKTSQAFGLDMQQWHRWLWNKPPAYGPEYFEFKSSLHSFIDPRFGTYFSQRAERATIRLDEVIWGGVKQDGIPPLRNPEMINASEADYLSDSDVVFGIEINGDVRAFPKRILAWHEMFTDTVGGIPVAGVYCTLCGTVILYETLKDGNQYDLGTSGFLYRSNKLMYDKKTQSLWSTLEGKPVIGPLVEDNISLEYRSVVTTSWGEWKARHPNSQVLSIDTGHSRDYSEGAAYRDYFATDELMFQVPKIDTRIRNKDEVLAVRLPEHTETSLAIASKFLKRNPVYSHALEGVEFTVFTDQSGAHRVYKTDGLKFATYDGKSTAIDELGDAWELRENSLESSGGQVLKRISTYNAFWFGYKAAFPDTQLIY